MHRTLAAGISWLLLASTLPAAADDLTREETARIDALILDRLSEVAVEIIFQSSTIHSLCIPNPA